MDFKEIDVSVSLSYRCSSLRFWCWNLSVDCNTFWTIVDVLFLFSMTFSGFVFFGGIDGRFLSLVRDVLEFLDDFLRFFEPK